MSDEAWEDKLPQCKYVWEDRNANNVHMDSVEAASTVPEVGLIPGQSEGECGYRADPEGTQGSTTTASHGSVGEGMVREVS
jgi:hypothetical protein